MNHSKIKVVETPFQVADPCISLKKLDAYNRGETDAKTIQAIEKHLLDCDICSTILEGLEKDKTDFSSIEKRFEMDFKQKFKKKKPLMQFALAAVFFSILAMVFISSRETPRNKLFDKYYQPYHSSDVFLRGESKQSKIIGGLQAYAYNEFETAARELKQVIAEEPENFKAIFYYAQSQMKLGNYEEAKAKFEKLASVDSSVYRRHSIWFLALIGIRDGNDQAVLQYLDEILTGEGQLTKSAQKLKNELLQIAN